MHRKYTTQKVVMAIMLVLVAVFAVIDFTYKTGPEPDVVCTMANQHIEWTYAKGAPEK